MTTRRELLRTLATTTAAFDAELCEAEQAKSREICDLEQRVASTDHALNWIVNWLRELSVEERAPAVAKLVKGLDGLTFPEIRDTLADYARYGFPDE